MKKPIFVSITLVFILFSIIFMEKIQKKYFSDQWENQTVFSINRENPRSYFFSFESKDLAKLRNADSSKFFKSLDGDWSFHFSKNPDDAVKGFEKVNFDQDII